jgi:hypothetical protein
MRRRTDLRNPVARLGSRDPETRRRAAKELALHPQREAVPKLCWRLNPEHDGSEDVREWCAYALGKGRAVAGVPTLVRALTDPIRDVRCIAASALGAIGDRRAAKHLRDLLQSDEDDLVCQYALTALATLAPTDDRTAGAAVRVAQDESRAPALRQLAARVSAVHNALSSEAAPTAQPMQLELLTGAEPTRPNGVHEPAVIRLPRVVYEPERDTDLAEQVKRQRRGICQVCGVPPFRTRTGAEYSEAHHIDLLAEGGPDTAENMLVLCANCHCKLQFANVEYERGRAGRPRAVRINGERFNIRWRGGPAWA